MYCVNGDKLGEYVYLNLLLVVLFGWDILLFLRYLWFVCFIVLNIM